MMAAPAPMARAHPGPTLRLDDAPTATPPASVAFWMSTGLSRALLSHRDTMNVHRHDEVSASTVLMVVYLMRHERTL